MQKFVLDWNVMKTWPLILWVIFFALVAFIVAYVWVLVQMYIGAGVLWLYGIWTVLLGAYIGFRSYTAKDIHIHHYTLMMILISYTCFQSKFLTITQGVFHGIMMEGVSRWGVDPVWTYPTDS
mmetsp:Transcript_5615/g.9675  ORF Transcript_5615/g.9675 Transcript_5615/m.9675 type:complete len:123 (-) Transcript_5615:158-526(-)